MLKLLKYQKDENYSSTNYVLINPIEIAAIEPYKYHSFRPVISRIILNNGEKIIVWDSVNEIERRLNKEE